MDNTPYWWPTHQHARTGGMYRFVADGHIEADTSAVVIYANSGGTVWVRPTAEFHDGRFTPLPVSNPDTSFDLVRHLHRQRAFSLHTFGPDQRTKGVVDHIRKELSEVEKAPTDVMEWADLILLSLDGAWRAGYTPEAIAMAINAKQTRNEGRKWPDWRTADPDKAIEHDRSGEIRSDAA